MAGARVSGPQWRETVAPLRPRSSLGALGDPLGDCADLAGGESCRTRRHPDVRVQRTDASRQQAAGSIVGGDPSAATYVAQQASVGIVDVLKHQPPTRGIGGVAGATSRSTGRAKYLFEDRRVGRRCVEWTACPIDRDARRLGRLVVVAPARRDEGKARRDDEKSTCCRHRGGALRPRRQRSRQPPRCDGVFCIASR